MSFIDKKNIILTEKSGKLHILDYKDKKISEIKHNLFFRRWTRWIT